MIRDILSTAIGVILATVLLYVARTYIAPNSLKGVNL